MTSLTPKKIVEELNRFIVGQDDAKRAVAIALRNRWRRQNVDPKMQEEIVPKNILMIGPTGVGKTEIARRLAKLADAPFIKTEATKFTEIGYVGRDVESIVRDILEVSISMVKTRQKEAIKVKAEEAAKNRILDVLVGENASGETREKFLKKLESGQLDRQEIEIDLIDNPSSPMTTFDIPGMPGAQMGAINIGDLLGKSFGGTNYRKRKVTIKDSYPLLMQEETDKLLDNEKVIHEAIRNVEQNGIVFIDEFDKICARSDGTTKGHDVSREGVQRDLLPLIEGTTVSTKHGIVKTDYILFIASGAFHLSKPSDLLPELQGRLPIRVELKALAKDDFVRILKEPEANLILQYQALMKTENVELEITDSAIDEIAQLAEEVNETVENIGARRLHTILEKLLEDFSFDAPDPSLKKISITPKIVRDKVGFLSKKTDLTKFIL